MMEILGEEKINKPWSIQIELTEGCNRRCTFCGIHSLYREKADVKYKHMSIDMATKIAKDLAAWLPKIRLEFALQGEPLLNPNHLEIFRIFRTEFPNCQIMVTSNCDPIKNVKPLFDAGVNILLADYYGGLSMAKFLKKLRCGIPIFDFYKDKPTVWGYVGKKARYIVLMDNTLERNFHRNLNNQAGNTSPTLMQQDNSWIAEKLPVKKRCHLPFREMSIKHDGAVPICCMDWQREKVLGKFPQVSFKEIWEGIAFKYARSILFQGERGAINPCDRCNYHAVKVGLVQNPFPEGQPPVIDSARYLSELQDGTYQNKYANKPFNYEGVTRVKK